MIADSETPLDFNQLDSFNQRESIPGLQHLLRQEDVLNTSRDLEKAAWLLAQELLQGPLAGFESEEETAHCGIRDVDGLADVVVRSHWKIEVAKTAVSEPDDFQLVFFGEVPLVPLYEHPFQVVLVPQLLDLFVAHWSNELVAGKQLLNGFLVSTQMTL